MWTRIKFENGVTRAAPDPEALEITDADTLRPPTATCPVVHQRPPLGPR